MKKVNMIIGLVGTNGAGKGAVVEIIQGFGFNHFSASDYINEVILQKGLEINRDNQRLVANQLRKGYFPDVIARELLKKALAKGGPAVIEAWRCPGEVESLLKQGVYVVGVDAPKELRYERISSRGSEKDNISFEKFLEQEAKESSGTSPWDMNIPKCIKMANFVFQNIHDKKQLQVDVSNYLKKFSAPFG